MRAHRRLAALSAVQLGFGLGGLAVAVRRSHAFDIPGWKGSPDRVGSDALTMGTALSAPGPMLLTQAVATVIAARSESRGARLVLGGLGAAMTCGYLIERLVRRRLTPDGWEPVESPVAAAGLAFAAATAVTAIKGERSVDSYA